MRSDDKYREAHHGADIMPLSGADLAAKPFAVQAGGDRFTVLESDGLTVTAFEVDHFPAAPAVGYRFDYRGRSVVISGDTKKLAAVARASSGVDVLIHDAMSQTLRQALADAAHEAGNARIAKLFNDIGDYHASAIEAAETANEAGARLLVYTHFVPALVQRPLRLAYFDGVDAIRPRKQWSIGEDGQRLDLPVDSSDIVRSRMALKPGRR
jgi:ribonuclease Z